MREKKKQTKNIEGRECTGQMVKNQETRNWKAKKNMSKDRTRHF